MYDEIDFITLRMDRSRGAPLANRSENSAGFGY